MKTKRFFTGILCALLLLTAIPQAAHAASLSAVTGLKTASRTTNGVSIRWNTVAGAQKYEVYRSYSYDGKYSLVATMQAASYNPTGLTSGREFYYKVRAVSGSTKGKFSGRLSSYTKGASRKGTIKTNGSAVNVRKHAGTSFAAVTSLARGTSVTIVADTQTKSGEHWYRVSAKVNGNNVKGYVRADLISSGTSTPSNPTSSTKKGRVSVSSSLRVRNGASTSAAIITSVSNGQIVTILGSKNGSGMKWYHITFVKGGKTYTGYAASQYIKVIS